MSKKISEMTPTGAAPANSELAIAYNGENYKISPANLVISSNAAMPNPTSPWVSAKYVRWSNAIPLKTGWTSGSANIALGNMSNTKLYAAFGGGSLQGASAGGSQQGQPFQRYNNMANWNYNFYGWQLPISYSDPAKAPRYNSSGIDGGVGSPWWAVCYDDGTVKVYAAVYDDKLYLSYIGSPQSAPVNSLGKFVNEVVELWFVGFPGSYSL